MRRVHLICLGLAVITLLVFARVYSADFVNYDDNDYVYDNAHVTHGVTLTSIRWAIGTRDLGNWHPLTWMSHMLDVQLYGLDASKHHITNVALHALATVLLFLLLRRITGAEWRSAIVAALFAWHPLHVESVAWISERKDMLSAIFWILTIWVYVRFTERKTVGRYLMTVFVFACALMSKPTTVSLPVVLLLIDFWPLKRLTLETFMARIVEKIPFFLLAIGVAIVTIYAQQRVGVVGGLHRYTIEMRVANAFIAYATYLVKTLAPTSLAVFYPHPATLPGVTIPPIRIFVAASAVVLLTVGALSQFRSRPFITVGWFWFIITLLPMIGLLQVGVQSHADRYTYISLIGIFIAIVWSWPDRLQNLGTMIAMAILSACLLMTFNQTAYWQNSITLFKHAADVVPDNYVAHYNLGTALVAENKIPDAVAHFREAIAIQPDYVDALANLGNALLTLRENTEAEKYLRIALDLNPNDADANNNLANLLADRGNSKDAEAHYLAAIKSRPTTAQLHHNYAILLAAQNRTVDAIDQWKLALKLRPDYANAQLSLAKELLRTGHGADVVARFHLSDPTQATPADAFGWLGWVLATDPDPKVRDASQSLLAATKSCELTRYSNAASLDALGAALAQAQHFTEAQSAAQRGAEIAKQQGDNVLAKEMSDRAKFYNARRAFIMMPTSQRAVP